MTAPALQAATLPSVTIPTVWHVGLFDPAAKKDRSYEGRGLSISVHPDDWQGIARLTGPTWELTNPHARFLDALSMTGEQTAAMTDWAVAEGLVEVATVWANTSFDCELDEDVIQTFLTRDEALAEAGWDENGDPTDPEPITRMVATARLAARDRTCRAGDIDPNGQVLGLYALHGPHPVVFDGVWWDENHDPQILSCPRGMIAPERLHRWVRTA